MICSYEMSSIAIGRHLETESYPEAESCDEQAQNNRHKNIHSHLLNSFHIHVAAAREWDDYEPMSRGTTSMDCDL